MYRLAVPSRRHALRPPVTTASATHHLWKYRQLSASARPGLIAIPSSTYASHPKSSASRLRTLPCSAGPTPAPTSSNMHVEQDRSGALDAGNSNAFARYRCGSVIACTASASNIMARSLTGSERRASRHCSRQHRAVDSPVSTDGPPWPAPVARMQPTNAAPPRTASLRMLAQASQGMCGSSELGIRRWHRWLWRQRRESRKVGRRAVTCRSPSLHALRIRACAPGVRHGRNPQHAGLERVPLLAAAAAGAPSPSNSAESINPSLRLRPARGGRVNAPCASSGRKESAALPLEMRNLVEFQTELPAPHTHTTSEDRRMLRQAGAPYGPRGRAEPMP